ncbi:hypothetical protein OU798_03625 [Prolixibacteraceae bacterium Z1-6]|uniref:Receptor L-domain domain-containing protein n=1 Tax=Draconibacterium aestuarii TaxID=2998507 RepID=A0A9X3J3J3_9BACT|nr:hypothetical protein [Prolixibacteraceae bacterium Z1-6]
MNLNVRYFQEYSHRGGKSPISLSCANKLFIPVFILFIIFSCQKEEKQISYYGDINISNQTELDDFAQKDYEEICGNLTIYHDANDSLAVHIGYLSSLNSIRRIEGNLSIISTEINSLNGLENLEYVGGKLLIEDNQYLKTFSGLQNLKHVGSLAFSGNTHVRSFDNFEHLESIDSSIVIRNTYLEKITEFENISELKGDVVLENNSFLSNLSGLNNIESIGRDLIISKTAAKSGLNGFINLKTIGGDFSISGDTKLSDTTFRNLTTVNGYFELKSSGITNVDGFVSLKETGGVILTHMEEVTGFSNLQYVRGDFILNWNLFLNSLEGLNNLKTIEGLLWFNFNYELYDIDGLEGLESIGGLDINNTPLGNLNGFENLKEINGDILVISMSLKDYCGIKNALLNFQYDFRINNTLISVPEFLETLEENCPSE